MQRVDFTPSDGINLLTLPTANGTLYSFLSERTGVDLKARIEGKEISAKLDTYVLVQSGGEGPTLIEAAGNVAVGGAPVFSTDGGRITAVSTDGKPLQASSQWKVSTASTPVVLTFPRGVTAVEVLLNDSGETARVEIAPGAKEVTIDREMSRYPVLLRFVP